MECGARYNVGWACVGWMTRSASTSSSRAWWEPRQKCTPPLKVIIDGASLPGWRELHRQLPPRDTTAHDVQDGVHYRTAAMLLGSSAAACRAARRRQQRFEDRPLCVGHRRRVHRATMSARRVGRARRAWRDRLLVWAGLGKSPTQPGANFFCSPRGTRPPIAVLKHSLRSAASVRVPAGAAPSGSHLVHRGFVAAGCGRFIVFAGGSVMRYCRFFALAAG